MGARRAGDLVSPDEIRRAEEEQAWAELRRQTEVEWDAAAVVAAASDPGRDVHAKTTWVGGAL
jgi:hypothetical protein